MRKHYTAAFKAEVAQEVLKEEKTIAQIASIRGVHPNLIGEWKSTAVKGLPRLAEEEDPVLEKERAAHERPVSGLCAESGRLTTQVNWLKKKAGVSDE